MRGALDLVALVHKLPETLPMREGAELTETNIVASALNIDAATAVAAGGVIHA